MGEMIKFGIKLAMTIACAVALCAAIALLFSVLSDLITSVSGNSSRTPLMDAFGIVTTVLPFNFYPLIAILTSLFSFKVAYWAADKMIQFIEAAG